MGGDGPVEQYRFVFDMKGSCEDCKGYVMNLEGDEREVRRSEERSDELGMR